MQPECLVANKMPEMSKMACTVCPRSSAPFYIVAYFIKWVTTSWAYSIEFGEQKELLKKNNIC